MNKLVLAFDSFKGSLSSRAIAETLADELSRLYPHCCVEKLSIADGGEGLTDTLTDASEGTKVAVTVHDPLMRPIQTFYGLSSDRSTAFIEMAAASGLPLLTADERNPWITTSWGTGELIADALERGCREVILGIGGSATNDGGMGMLSALGFRFLDRRGNRLNGCGADLEQVADVDCSEINPRLNDCVFRVACDVNNPFYGSRGAAYVYAAQKGADERMIEQLDRGLESFARLALRLYNVDLQAEPGSGAAGGMGGGLFLFLKARLQRGIELVLDYLDFDTRIAGADWVITGEGKSDRQTLMGKAPQGVLTAAARQQIPVALFAGRIDDARELRQGGFSALCEVSPRSLPLDEAMRPEVTMQNLRLTLHRFLSSELFRTR